MAGSEKMKLPRHSELPYLTAKHSLGNRNSQVTYLFLSRNRPMSRAGQCCALFLSITKGHGFFHNCFTMNC